MSFVSGGEGVTETRFWIIFFGSAFSNYSCKTQINPCVTWQSQGLCPRLWIKAILACVAGVKRGWGRGGGKEKKGGVEEGRFFSSLPLPSLILHFFAWILFLLPYSLPFIRLLRRLKPFRPLKLVCLSVSRGISSVNGISVTGETDLKIKVASSGKRLSPSTTLVDQYSKLTKNGDDESQ